MVWCRKNPSTLTSTEKARFVAAVLALKATGKYDIYVQQHMNFMSCAHRASRRSGQAAAPGRVHPIRDGVEEVHRRLVAMMEATLLLATIARRWRFEVAPTEIGMQPSITLRPAAAMPGQMRSVEVDP